MGGFECASQRRRDGVRLDMTAATRHDDLTEQDYRQLAGLGMHTVRDGLRWHLIAADRATFDWTSLDPMLAAARATGTQVIWDLLHYGWPDWTNPFDADFIAHFADFAYHAAQRIGPGGCYVAINEISFLAWGGGEVGYLNPFVCGRGEEMKNILCRAAIAATRRIRAVDPHATMVAAEPLIRAHPAGHDDAAIEQARAMTNVQYDAIDVLLGRRNPESGGSEDCLDVIGVNFYPHNQWLVSDPPVRLLRDRSSPLNDLLIAAYSHYRRPLLIAETGGEDDDRADWARYVADEVTLAGGAGCPIMGVCFYPILDHPGWDDDRHCRHGLLCGYGDAPRPVYEPLAAALNAFNGSAPSLRTTDRIEDKPCGPRSAAPPHFQRCDFMV